MRYTNIHFIFFLIFLALIIVNTSCREQESEFSLSDGEWIDLSYAFDENTIYWPTSDEFHLDTVAEGMTEKGYYYAAFSFCTAEHGGTHLDAPVHFAEGKQAVEEIPLENLIGEAALIDVSETALNNADYQITVQDLEDWEATHGNLSGKILLLKSGYGQFWPDKMKYMGTAERGIEAVDLLHFPGLHPSAAQWLVDNRSVKAIGIDTPSIDYGQSKLFESHRILFESNIPAFENVANLNQLPAHDFFVFALPVKIRGGSGGPVRIVAYIPN